MSVVRDAPMPPVDTAVWWIEFMMRNRYSYFFKKRGYQWWDHNAIDHNIYPYLVGPLKLIFYSGIFLLSSCIFFIKFKFSQIKFVRVLVKKKISVI